MKQKHQILTFIAVSFVCFLGAEKPLRAQELTFASSKPIIIPGKPAKFDFMGDDSANDRILAAHAEAGNLTVIDAQTGTLLAEIPVGHAQGLVVDKKQNQYIVGDDDEHKIVFIDAKSLKKTAEVQTEGPIDAIDLDTKRNRIYADEDHGKKIWVIDSQSKKIITTIMIPKGPEVIAYDTAADRIFQNIKNSDSFIAINPSTQKIESSWPTFPATAPHGLAIDSNLKHAFIAGHNGKLVEIDITNGKVISTAEIAPGTDQIAFDSKNKTIFCASKGFISVVRETGEGLQFVTHIPSPKGAHTIAVDQKRHDIWVSYADKDHSYLKKFEAVR